MSRLLRRNGRAEVMTEKGQNRHCRLVGFRSASAVPRSVDGQFVPQGDFSARVTLERQPSMREGELDDPVYIRWKRQHPHFPGVAKCIELLRRRNVRGGLVDIICHELQANATAHAAELIAAFRCERDDRVRRILLSIICEASLPEAFPLLMEYLRSDDEGLRYWAVEGLRRLDTPHTRKVLWKAGYLVPPKTRG